MSDASAARVRAEKVIAQAIAQSWDEGYGDCPHGKDYSPCAECDAHWAADALIKEGLIRDANT